MPSTMSYSARYGPRRRLPPPPPPPRATHRLTQLALQVRGILNKLTPEKFHKLSDDLLGLELDSDKVLKGVILLIFEKALDEPKYSSMYAQLCKRLSEEAPDFERAGAPCTFRLLLLNKCRAEFENRALAFQQYEGRALAPDEEEKRHLAKCKMLGNIKFIGELGKLEILAESILHRCIQQLLARRAAADHHEDLECLAQLVRTCGRVLDSERGRGLMDQYFARIETLSASRDLAPRIRFMLRDVVELRRGGWVPRAATAASNEGPVPMHQLRDDDEPPAGARRHHDRHERDRHAARDRPHPHHDPHRGDRDRDPLFRGGLRSRPLDDVFAGLGLQPGSALVPPSDKLFGNGFAARDAHRQRSAPGGGGGGGGGGAGGYFPRAQPNNNHYKHGSAAGAAGKDAARAGKARVLPPAALHDVQMRPAANSLMFTANRISKPQPQPQLAPVPQSVLAPTFAAAPLLKEPAITIKPAPDKKDKPKKDKGPNKEEACRLALEAVAAVAREYVARVRVEARADADADADVEADADADGTPDPDDDEEAEPRAEPLRRLLELQAPDKVLRRCITAVLEATLAGAEAEAEAEAWAACRVLRCVKRAPLHEGARQALQAAAARAPAAEGALPRLAARLVAARLLPLAEVAAWCEAGAHHPLLLEVLRHLRAYTSLRHTQRLVHDAKIELCAYAVMAAGGEAAGLAALEARGLGALAPMLRVRAALARQLAAEPAPAALYRWIKTHVEASVRASPAFVSALVALLAGHVTRAAGTDAPQPDKAALERERQLLEPYAPLLTALLRAEPALQLAAVYAAQLHAHQHRYPKGMLLRWFMHLYNMEVCEEDAFLRWREDVTDAYPGKGEALFQVNTWLTWLQQQESEEEEGED